MKKILIYSCATALFAALLGVCGAGETGKNKPASKPRAASTRAEKTGAVTETRVLTGSYLKSTYKRTGQLTDGHSQVAVLDQQAIEASGAADLQELLIRRGLRR